jgi:uncharacterized RDD family membrane protein YckC
MTDAVKPLPRSKVAKPPASDWREFVTPEGVDLRLRIGDAGERAGAFLLDLVIMVLALVVVTIAAASVVATTRLQGSEFVGVIWLIGFFFLRCFYFTAFELQPAAATPGKRIMGLRVIARDGGRLTADAVFARNAMRELEVFVPLMFIFGGGRGVDAWMSLLGVLWSGIFLFFPLFNRDRLRLGDLAAGSMVVKAPRKVLPPDLAEDGMLSYGAVVFTTAQLDAYGVKELHVLEDVLRRGDRKTIAAVATRIRAKLGMTDPPDVSDLAFLSAYYAGLRGRLERRMLFGHRRKDKFDT